MIQDWTREEIQAVYDLPFVELLYRAATVRVVFPPRNFLHKIGDRGLRGAID